MKNIRINDSYNIWNVEEMKCLIYEKCLAQYNSYFPERQLNRTYNSMYVEWWLHNIGYYVTRPFCNIDFFNKINLRCKDVDLEEKP